MSSDMHAILCTCLCSLCISSAWDVIIIYPWLGPLVQWCLCIVGYRRRWWLLISHFIIYTVSRYTRSNGLACCTDVEHSPESLFANWAMLVAILRAIPATPWKAFIHLKPTVFKLFVAISANSITVGGTVASKPLFFTGAETVGRACNKIKFLLSSLSVNVMFGVILPR